MALVDCRECGEKISTEAESCPNCGCPEPAKRPESDDRREQSPIEQARRTSGEPDFEGDEGHQRTVCPNCDSEFDGKPAMCPRCGVELSYDDGKESSSDLLRAVAWVGVGFIFVCIGLPVIGEISMQMDSVEGSERAAESGGGSEKKAEPTENETERPSPGSVGFVHTGSESCATYVARSKKALEELTEDLAVGDKTVIDRLADRRNLVTMLPANTKVKVLKTPDLNLTALRVRVLNGPHSGEVLWMVPNTVDTERMTDNCENWGPE